MRLLELAVICIAVIVGGCGELNEMGVVEQVVKAETASDPVLPVLPTPEPLDYQNLVRANVFYIVGADDPHTEKTERRIRASLRNARAFYADEMERHGYGRRTFEVERGDDGAFFIHRFTLQHPKEFYYTNGVLLHDEIRAWEGSLPQHQELGDAHHQEYWGRIPTLLFIDAPERDGSVFATRYTGACAHAGSDAWHWDMQCYDLPQVGWDWPVVAHEFGHVLGLQHDFRDPQYLMGPLNPGERPMLSEESARWLNYHSAATFTEIRTDTANIPIKLVSTDPFTFKVRYLAKMQDDPIGYTYEQPTRGLEYAIAWFGEDPLEGDLLGGSQSVRLVDTVYTALSSDNSRWTEDVVYQVVFDTAVNETDEIVFRIIGKDGHSTEASFNYESSGPVFEYAPDN